LGEGIVLGKVNPDKYIVSKGRLTGTNSSELISINFPSSIPIDTLIRIKFYELPKAENQFEISEVYLTGFGTAYFLNITTVNYFYDGKWNALKADLAAKDLHAQEKYKQKTVKKIVAWTLGIGGAILTACILIVIIGVSSSGM
ncbi:MAG: hypothetical protein ACFFC1_07575, partial [Promethearchaeota archaeon]